ncbi:putative transcriptional regulatory protein [Psilocybe cubensis]|uniref:Transcriptional regulatory protein n=1 Tax=Psilocybe cubensis TaxID=181762 RepID=A0ACB8GTM9_PSICU|nr:putative transcriptional regulatory protein [Psilocybe cubensis]KAH9478722.1 putative transcriptional regulatory protein [Psilocybe cubensis]
MFSVVTTYLIIIRYIQILEGRIQALEECIEKLRRDANKESCTTSPDTNPSPTATQGPDAALSCLYAQDPQIQSVPFDNGVSSATLAEETEIPETGDLAHVALAQDMTKLSMSPGSTDRFFGQASVFMFARDVYIVRESVTGDNAGLDPKQHRRLTFWDTRPWEVSFVTASEEHYVYPEEDLLLNLVELYFEKTNSMIPVLHRPTFMKSLCLRQHHWDPSFGMIVLLVCALGSKYSQDPRVNEPDDSSGLSSGWKYFSQVPIHRKVMLVKTTVYDLQYFSLAAQYLMSTSMPQASWDVLGIGLRYALEQGAHRRKGQNQTRSAENELRKRAFWFGAIVCLDRIGSSFLGRPCAFPHETFDVEYPVECDDEYWETDDPALAFQQPAGKPCSITGFVCLIKLCEILGFVLRTLYSNKKSRLLSGFVGNDWEGRMVAALDSAMNEWKDSLPDYLHWDPDRPNSLFFHQSVNLHATYYYVQMQMHRQFLTKKNSITFTSLAMCSNAARACARVLEAGMTRGLRVLPNTMIAAFTAGVLMVLAFYGGQCAETEYISNPEEEKSIYNKCVNVLKECERRWHPAGRLRDILNEVGTLNQYFPVPAASNRKRRRHLFDAEFSAQPSISSAGTSNHPQHVTPDTSSSTSTCSEEMLPYDSDLQNLMLAEMGYVPGDFKEGVQDCADLNSDTTDNSCNIPPSDDLTLGADMFGMWLELVSASSKYGLFP